MGVGYMTLQTFDILNKFNSVSISMCSSFFHSHMLFHIIKCSFIQNVAFLLTFKMFNILLLLSQQQEGSQNNEEQMKRMAKIPSIRRLLNPTGKRKTVVFVFVGNKDDQINLTAVVVYISNYPSIWHLSIPNSNQLHFQWVCAQKQHKNSQKEHESEEHFPYHSAYSGRTNVLCIPDVI